MKKKKMSKRKLNNFRKLFLAKRAEILKNAKESEEIDIDGDDVDVVQGALINLMAERLTQREQIRLNNIDAAIRRLDDGTFGECEECEEQIPEPRLLARPESTTCIACAEKIEKASRDYM